MTVKLIHSAKWPHAKFGALCGMIASCIVLVAAAPNSNSQPTSNSSKTSTTQSQNAASNSSDPQITFVETVVLDGQTHTTMPRTFTGILNASRSSDLGVKRTGRVEKVLVDQGDTVRKGDVLAELDKATLLADLAVAEAKLRSAEAKLREFIAGPRKQTIEAARAQVEALTAARDQAALSYNRRKQLAGSEAISLQDIDDARLQLAASEGRLRAQLQALEELTEGTRKEQVDAQRSEVANLAAAVDSLQVALSESKLIAPYDAVVSQRLVDEGVIVSPSVVLMRIVELGPAEAWIGVPPEMTREFILGSDYPLVIQSQSRTGKLKAVLPELDPSTRTQTAIFKVQPMEVDRVRNEFSTPRTDTSAEVRMEPRENLALGQIVQLNLAQRVDRAGYWVPMSALTRGVRGLWSAYVVVEQKMTLEVSDAKSQGNNEAGDSEPEYIVKRTDVEIIQIDSDRVLIRGTLSDGDRIVTSGIQKLTVGQRVRLAEQTNAAENSADENSQ